MEFNIWMWLSLHTGVDRCWQAQVLAAGCPAARRKSGRLPAVIMSVMIGWEPAQGLQGAAVQSPDGVAEDRCSSILDSSVCERLFPGEEARTSCQVFGPQPGRLYIQPHTKQWAFNNKSYVFHNMHSNVVHIMLTDDTSLEEDAFFFTLFMLLMLLMFLLLLLWSERFKPP